MNNAKLISPSVMCADLMNMGEALKTLEKEGVEMIHLDMMDAHFVPNLTFGPDMVNAIRATSSLIMDVHLMVTDPELTISKLRLSQGDYVTCHVEIDDKVDYRALSEKLHSQGLKFGLAINPDTPVETLVPHVPYLDMVIVMTVHPGFAGAQLVEGILPKVGQVRQAVDAAGGENILVSVDGSVSWERAAITSALGANVFVGGTKAIYRKDVDMHTAIVNFRKAINGQYEA